MVSAILLQLGLDLSLKILVSVVRFRPGPPRTSFTQRPLKQVGVVVSGVRSFRVRSISDSLNRNSHLTKSPNLGQHVLANACTRLRPSTKSPAANNAYDAGSGMALMI